jgi:DNA-binding IscR family transcriptional regulator
MILDDDQMRSMRLSVQQERLFDALLQSYIADPLVVVRGAALGILTGSNRVQVLRVKLRRLGWDIVSKNGKDGGYRLARLPP